MSKYYDTIKKYFRSKWTSKKNIKVLLARYFYNELDKLMCFLIQKERTILEIGCGDGNLLRKLKPREAVGAYIVTDHVKEKEGHIKAKHLEHIKFIETLPEDMSDVKGYFDYVLFYNSLGYIKDIEKSFKEIKKICKKDTRIVITYYNYLWEPIFLFLEKIGLKEKLEIRQNWLSAQDVKIFLTLCDFELIEKGESMLVPVYVPIVSVLLNKYLARFPLVRRLCLMEYIIARPCIKEREEYTVSVIVPARNEAGTIEEIVKRVPQMGKNTEIIFVEGHSKDNTMEEIKRVMKKYKDKEIKLFIQEGKGKGDAMRKGYDHASGDVLMILDADITVIPEELEKFYNALIDGRGEFINGSRLVYPMEDEAMRFLNLIGNKGFGLTFSWLLNQKIKDTLCGTKVLFKKDYEKIKAGRSYFGNFDPFGDFDLLFGAAKLHMKIIEVPIRYKSRVYGSTNIQRFAHGWLLIKMCVFASKKLKFV